LTIHHRKIRAICHRPQKSFRSEITAEDIGLAIRLDCSLRSACSPWALSGCRKPGGSSRWLFLRELSAVSLCGISTETDSLPTKSAIFLRRKLKSSAAARVAARLLRGCNETLIKRSRAFNWNFLSQNFHRDFHHDFHRDQRHAVSH